MRITKVTTRTGDDGTSGLADGSRVPKNDLRLHAYGTVDELGACLGLAVAAARESLPVAVPREPAARASDEAFARVLDHLTYVQNQLFTVAGDLATPIASRFPGMPVVEAAHADYLERLIAALNAELPPLRDFVLAGPPAAAAHLQLARCVCRRAERHVQELGERDEIGPWVLRYLNRLSDALFVLGRWITHRSGVAESTWKRDLAEPELPSPAAPDPADGSEPTRTPRG